MGWTPNLAGRLERPPALTVSIVTSYSSIAVFLHEQMGEKAIFTSE